jgi:hypothetical protein
MAFYKLPPPPIRLIENPELAEWVRQLYTFLGEASIDGLQKKDGTLTIAAKGAPPAPVIAQQQLTISIGYQFAFNFLQSGVVDGYWIYKNSTNDPATAFRYKAVRQSLNGGLYTFQDNVGSATAYYWVTAINARGESAKVAAFSATVTDPPLPPTSTMTVYRPSSSTGTGYTNPGAAYDNNLNQSAFASQSGIGSKTTTWAGFPAAPGTPTAIILKIVSAGEGDTATSRCKLEYSLDGGATWEPQVYLIGGTSFSRTDPIALLAAQDMTLVKVRATASGVFGSDAVFHSIAEIWAEVTT